MNARRLGDILGLELYAIALAMAQYIFIGVRTQEAEALLNIPSSQPPLARFLLNLLDGWVYQELFWRIVFATLLVQAVWLVLDQAKDLSHAVRIAVAAAWLFSIPVVLQAGTLMPAPLAALQGLVFVWLTMNNRTRDGTPTRTHGGVRLDAWGIGIVWLASLFTAYQALLYAPVVWGAMRSRVSVRLAAFMIPIAMLALYTLIHPLIFASMTSLFSLETYDDAILLLPLLIAGFLALARRSRVAAIGTALLVPVSTVLLLWSFPHLLPTPPIDAARVLATIGAPDRPGDILIAGPFGHEWQYASERPVRRYAARHLSEAAAVVCLQPCEEMERQERWERIAMDPVAVWIPKR